MIGYLTAALAIVAGAVVLYREQAKADDRSNHAYLALHHQVSASTTHLVLPTQQSVVSL